MRVAEPGVLLRRGVLELLHSEPWTPSPAREGPDEFTLFTSKDTSLTVGESGKRVKYESEAQCNRVETVEQTTEQI